MIFSHETNEARSILNINSQAVINEDFGQKLITKNEKLAHAFLTDCL